MNQEAYLNRINFQGALQPTLKVLDQLQKSHLLHIPFENLDIHYGRPIELNIDKIFKKIVKNQRGGFCYECNGLFHELLKSIGFEVKMISARVYDANKGFGFEYDHLVNRVRIEGIDYITDVGFGDFTFQPLKMDLGILQKDERGIFKIEKHEAPYFCVFKKESEGWTPQYLFSTKQRAYEEYAAMCYYHQSSPDSHFVQNKLITLAKENGRITLTRNKLKIREGNKITELKIKTEQEFQEQLWDYFRIRI